MPTLKRYKTDYKGVHYIMGTSAKGKPERIYYIRYRNKDGKQIDEKAGRQSKDDMSAARAATLRIKRIGGEPSNEQKREQARKEKEKEAGKWTFTRLWEKYLEDHPGRRLICECQILNDVRAIRRKELEKFGVDFGTPGKRELDLV